MLYVGAALILAAGIFGFTDYAKASGAKEFKSMYENKSASIGMREAKLMLGNAGRLAPEPITPMEEILLDNAKDHKTMDLKIYSRAALEREE